MPTPRPNSTPRFASALSTRPDTSLAEEECLRGLEASLGERTPDLIAVFATHHHGDDLRRLGVRLATATGCPALVGCTSVSVIGGDREAEGEPGLAVWAASLPATKVRFFEVSAAQGPEDKILFSAVPPVPDPERSSILILADPFTFPMDRYLIALDEERPGVPAMGGMASGGRGPGESLLFTADGVRDGGAVGVVLEGGIELRPVVSQGCRPVGKPWVVTECDQHLIKKLGGKPALDALMETWRGLPEGEQALMQRMPFVGLAIDAAKSEFDRGDFLVRHVMGIEDKQKWVAVGDFVRRGQTVQFLVRDADSAGEDLRLLMASQGGGALGTSEPDEAGALLFTCTGRGLQMFPEPHHDVRCVRSGLRSDVPTAGFFCAGEIGPVGGRNFLHGFTASVAVFRPRP